MDYMRRIHISLTHRITGHKLGEGSARAHGGSRVRLMLRIVEEKLKAELLSARMWSVGAAGKLWDLWASHSHNCCKEWVLGSMP